MYRAFLPERTQFVLGNRGGSVPALLPKRTQFRILRRSKVAREPAAAELDLIRIRKIRARLYETIYFADTAHWHDMNFSGVLPKGTPGAQCMAVKRESWVAHTAPLTADETQQVHELTWPYRAVGPLVARK